MTLLQTGRYATKWAVAVFVLTLVSVSGLVGVSVAGAATTTVRKPAAALSFYLDLGGSASVGVQPTLNDPRGERTDSGYANDVVSFEGAHGVNLQLSELGCPGESTSSMINGSDACYPAHDSQLREADAFLMTHQNDDGLVTVDIGFNNVRSCFKSERVNTSCVTAQITLVKRQLSQILSALHGDAGPAVTIVGLGHYDPFLAYGRLGPADQAFAMASESAVTRLNAVLAVTYASHGVAMAPVGAAFSSHDDALVDVTGVGMEPDSVAATCALTWMCQSAPYGPNIHPSDAGYSVIAGAIEEQFKVSWLAAAPRPSPTGTATVATTLAAIAPS